MKKLIVLFSILGLFLLTPFALAGGKFDGSKRAVVTLNEEDVVDKDYFVTGELVEIFGTVNGDAYIVGGEVIIDGTVNGDVLVGGGNVTISGSVSQDVRVIGGNVTINGEVGRNISAVGGNIYITEGGDLSGNVVLAGGNVRLTAPVAGDATIAAGTLIVSDRIGGGLKTRADLVRINPKAEIDGDFEYWSPQEALIDEGAIVTGETNYNQVTMPEMETRHMKDVLVGFKVFSNFVGFISALVIGLLIVRFYPRFTQKVAKTVLDKPLASFGAGIITVLVLPIFAVVLLISVLGMKLGFILLALFSILLCTSRIFAMLLIGQWVGRLFSKDLSQSWALIVGALVFYILTLLPGLGPLLSILALLFGLGGVLLAKKEFYNELKDKKLI